MLSYSLYRVCSPADYNLWANSYGIIFITLLWIDGGLRKSIPRFAPLFAAQGTTRSFLYYLTLFQAIGLIITTPVVAYAFSKLQTSLAVTYQITIQVIMIFLLEGILSCIRLIYYSYFWHKSFNQKYLLLLTIETIIACILIITHAVPLIPTIFALKIFSCLILIIITLRDIPSIINDPAYQQTGTNGTHGSEKQFMIHTAAMWGSNAIKSLSERNVMMLLLSYLFSPEQANLFKVANDGAVVVYRTLIKTIGTTDTSLLAHSQIIGAGEVGLQRAFQKVSAKVAALCLPLLGLIGGMYTASYYYEYDHNVFTIIFILIISYVLEVAFSSYERVLEINFRYRYLAYAYVPYLLLILLPLFISTLLSLSLTHALSLITCIGLVNLLICIHSVRLVSTLLMVYFARRLYDLTWPVSLYICISRLALFYIVGIPIGLVLIYLGTPLRVFISR